MTMAGFLGIQEIVLLIVLFVIIFGAKRLPDLGRSLGRGMREFRSGITGKD
jgi:sec-independent protein translocase protein TatA